MVKNSSENAKEIMSKENLGEMIKRQFPNARRKGTQKIPMNMLHADLSYQKTPSKVKIKKIKNSFDWLILDPLVVSYRNGRYNVVDGQHRLCAIIELYNELKKIAYIECRIIEGLTKEDECKLFRILADRRTVGMPEKLKVEYESGDVKIIKIVNLLNDIGIIFDFSNSPAVNRDTAIKATIELYDKLGDNSFVELFKLIKNTWNGKSSSLQEQHILGISKFFVKYNLNFNCDNFYDEQAFIKVLSNHSPEDIRKEIGTVKGDKFYSRFVEEIFERYNKGTRKHKLSK